MSVESRVDELQNIVQNHEKRLNEICDLLQKTFSVLLGKNVTLDLAVQELNVRISHSEHPISISTNTNDGKIMYCAVTDLKPGASFSEREMREILNERGWPMAHGTIAPILSDLTKKGWLVKKGQRPVKYRLPQKVTVSILE